MTYCPRCGTANRDGSRFCNECGEKLGTQMQPKCPQCGTLNPVQNVFCSECGGRLLSSAPSATGSEATQVIKGLSLPTKPSMGEDEESTSELAAPGSEEDTPAWLKELGAIPSPPLEAGEAIDTGGVEEIPDWLTGLSPAVEPEVSESPTAPEIEEGEMPDWLADLRPTEFAKDTAPVSADPGSGEEDAPDWLADFRPTTPSEEPGPASATLEIEREDATEELSDLEPTPSVDELVPAAEIPEIEEGEVPDWLASLGATPDFAESEPTAALPELAEGDVPDWLADLRPTTPAEEAKPAVPPREAEEEDVPDWLAGIGAAAVMAASESAAPISEADEEEVPDWLASLSATAPEEESQPAAFAPEADEEEVPDWLSGLSATAPEEETEPTALAPDAEEEEVSDWLAELRSTAPARDPEAAEEIPEPEEEEVPDWLAGLSATAVEEESEPTTPAPEAEEGEPSDLPDAQEPEQEEASSETATVLTAAGLAAAGAVAADIPDWLSELGPTTPERPMDAEMPAPVEEPETADATMPDWLSELKPEEEVEGRAGKETPGSAEIPDWLAGMAPPEPEEDTLVDEALAQAELPDWLVPSEGTGTGDPLEQAEIPTWLLALKPQELREEDEEVESEEQPPAIQEGVEETGLLAGLAGTLPVEMLIAQPRTTVPEIIDILPETDSPKARLFAEIVARPPSVTPKAVTQHRSHVLRRVHRLIICLALIIAVAVPLLLGKSVVPRSVDASQAALDLNKVIDSLPTNAAVLIAFDYDPATSDEMDVVARAITSHLADRKAQMVAFGLLPAGPAMAEAVLEETAGDGNYVNLGYLPGQATAVRLLGQSIKRAIPRDYQGTPLQDVGAMNGLDSLADFDLVIELAPTQNSLQWWIEQGSTPYDVPLGAGTSASADPLARPYYETDPRQLVGLVSGVQGAAMYDSLTRGEDSLSDALGARLDAQLAGHMVFILVLVVGNGIYFFQRRNGEER